MDWNKFQYNPLPRGRLAVDTRAFRHRGGAAFDPRGDVQVVGDADKLRKNPVTAEDVVSRSARLFVGLSVAKVNPVTGELEVVREFSPEDAITITRRVRTFQTGAPDATFLVGRGIFKYAPGVAPTEDSLQIIILDFEAKDEAEFEEQMGELAEVLAQDLEQQLVFVELQRAGIPYRVLRVTP